MTMHEPPLRFSAVAPAPQPKCAVCGRRPGGSCIASSLHAMLRYPSSSHFAAWLLLCSSARGVMPFAVLLLPADWRTSLFAGPTCRFLNVLLDGFCRGPVDLRNLSIHPHSVDRPRTFTAAPGLVPAGNPCRGPLTQRPILPWALPLPGFRTPHRCAQAGSTPHGPSASGHRFRLLSAHGFFRSVGPEVVAKQSPPTPVPKRHRKVTPLRPFSVLRG